jgi:aspartate/methionine/tyrosine aminotransferase
VKIDQFLVERFMNQYEHNVELNLAETCVDPFLLGDFLKLAGKEDFFEDLTGTQLTYGFIEGSPQIREGLAKLYENQDPDNILVTGGAIGANFLTMYSLVEPGDTVISIFPAYQQLYSAAKSFGADVKLLKLKPEEKWLPNLDELDQLIDDKTKLIIINNPHNPTGSLIETPLLKKICKRAEDSGAFLLCDEVYRDLYNNPEDKVASAVDVSQSAIVTGSFSKALSLAGLRLGWIAANEEIIKECMHHRDYTTISNGLIDDALGALAIKNADKILKRNQEIVRTNHRILSEWIANEPLIDWVPPRAGSVGFMQHHLSISSEELCVRLINEMDTFMVPGTCFEMDGYLRIGFGCKTEVLQAGLGRFKTFLNTIR